jgi:hypothetical protein
MKNRFDLEWCIHDFNNFADELDTVLEYISEGMADEDTVSNAILGISTMIRLHSEKTFDTMCQALRLDMYNEIPVDEPAGPVCDCDECDCTDSVC